MAAGPAQAACVGTCGSLGADGDITASPAGGEYNYVSTVNGVAGGGSLGVGTEINGSQSTTATFAANAGSVLSFYFNYVTSDGDDFSDYGWSQLQTPGGTAVATLFSARTTPSGDTVPGFGLPGLLATLTPISTPVLPGSGGVDLSTGYSGGPVWSALGVEVARFVCTAA